MKKFGFLISLILLGLFIDGCKPAYVSVKPTYDEAPRPARPSDKHIWITGDWVWDNRTKAYVRQESQWMIPNGKRDYTQGKWKTTQQGYYWSPSRWR